MNIAMWKFKKQFTWRKNKKNVLIEFPEND